MEKRRKRERGEKIRLRRPKSGESEKGGNGEARAIIT